MKSVALFLAFLWSGIIGASAQVDRCDVNGEGEVDISDVTYVVDHILGRGHANVFTGEAIDLDLPSGTKWASCNVGATKPEEYGGYYAWGETEEKDISGTKYDVAHVKWGGNWCMPTKDDIKELLDNCTYEWTTLNGVNGRKFTSNINGNSIFLPAAGYRWYGALRIAGEDGYYWLSTQYPDGSSYAYSLYFESYGAYWSDGDRYCGQSVRPVVRN